MALENLKSLKDDMVNKQWTICSFMFNYKEIEYIVLVKRFVGKEKRTNNYALVKLHFMKSADLKDDLEVEANARGCSSTQKSYVNISELSIKKILAMFFGNLRNV